MTVVGGDRAFDFYEVDARDDLTAQRLSDFNDLFTDEFYPLERHHFEKGQWLVVTTRDPVPKFVAFAGSVPFSPFEDYLYFKRVAVLPEYRGQSLQCALMQLTEALARKAGYTHLVSTTDIENIYSANNFVRTGWRLTKPEKPWEPSSLYWIKKL